MATAAAHRRPDAGQSPARPSLKDYGRSVFYCVAGLPIAVAGLKEQGNSAQAVIRRSYARRFWRPKSLSELSQLLLGIVISPFVVAGLGAVFTSRNGRGIARRSGRGIRLQILDQLRLYLTAGVLPPWYYIFELYRQPLTSNARNFIYRWESKGGVMRLLAEGDLKPRSVLNDKAKFAAHCRRHGIATVPILGMAQNGKLILDGPPSTLDMDLFIKPVSGRGGKGAERWDYLGKGRYRHPSGRELTREELIAHLEERSLKKGVLIQPRMDNHAALAALNNGALSTVRVLTCLDEHGEPELAGAAVRMAISDNHVVDNLHAGGIAAAVDLDTGALGPASNLGTDSRLGWLDHHPDSGAAITGTRLPLWSEVREFALKAHRAFDDRTIIGWDIAITRHGPVLIEGNGSPDLDIMQRFGGKGLMSARFAALVAFHLAQLGFDGRQNDQAAVSIPSSPSFR